MTWLHGKNKKKSSANHYFCHMMQYLTLACPVDALAYHSGVFVPDKGKEGFQKMFGISWEDALKSGKVLNAKDAYYYLLTYTNA